MKFSVIQIKNNHEENLFHEKTQKSTDWFNVDFPAYSDIVLYE